MPCAPRRSGRNMPGACWGWRPGAGRPPPAAAARCGRGGRANEGQMRHGCSLLVLTTRLTATAARALAAASPHRRNRRPGAGPDHPGRVAAPACAHPWPYAFGSCIYGGHGLTAALYAQSRIHAVPGDGSPRYGGEEKSRAPVASRRGSRPAPIRGMLGHLSSGRFGITARGMPLRVSEAPRHALQTGGTDREGSGS